MSCRLAPLSSYEMRVACMSLPVLLRNCPLSKEFPTTESSLSTTTMQPITSGALRSRQMKAGLLRRLRSSVESHVGGEAFHPFESEPSQLPLTQLRERMRPIAAKISISLNPKVKMNAGAKEVSDTLVASF